LDDTSEVPDVARQIDEHRRCTRGASTDEPIVRSTLGIKRVLVK
jgi:hypothetical protein